MYKVRLTYAVFVLDEPTIGLHSLDEIANADYVIDMGPGGWRGGRIVTSGTPEEVADNQESI